MHTQYPKRLHYLMDALQQVQQYIECLVVKAWPWRCGLGGVATMTVTKCISQRLGNCFEARKVKLNPVRSEWGGGTAYKLRRDELRITGNAHYCRGVFITHTRTNGWQGTSNTNTYWRWNLMTTLGRAVKSPLRTSHPNASAQSSRVPN